MSSGASATRWWESTADVIDFDAELRGRGFSHSDRIHPGDFVAIGAWWAGLSLAGKIIVGLLASAGLYYAAKLLQRPAYVSETEPASRTYAFTARRNTEGIGAPIPLLYGEHRVFGHKAMEYIDTVADVDTLYTQLIISRGPIAGMFLPELNEQPLESYAGAKAEFRYGTEDQLPIAWFADARNTYLVGVDMPDDGDSFVYRTFTKVDKFIPRVRFPGGVQGVSGGADVSSTVTVRVEHRRLGTFAWTSLGDQLVTRNTRKPVTVQFASDALGGTARRSPSVVVNNASRGGPLAWTTPGSAAVSDDARATATDLSGIDVQTQWLEATSFGFDQVVPATATILGVLAEVELSAFPPTGDPGDGHGNGATVREAEVYLLVGGAPVGSNKKNTTDTWPASDTVWSRGGPGAFFDVPGGLTAAQVRAPGFGIAHSALVNNDTARIDAIWLTVYFSDPATLESVVREVRVTRVSTTATPKVPMSFDSIDEIRFGGGLPNVGHPGIAYWGYAVQAGEQLQSRPTASVFARGRTVREIVSGLNGVVAFDGTNDYISIPHIASYALNVFTLEALVWLEDLGQDAVFIGKADNYFLWWDAANQALRFEFRNSADTAYRGMGQDGGGTYVLSPKTWTRISASFGGSGTTMKLYADGVLVGETAVINENPKQDTGILAIGRWGSNGSRYLKGRADDGRLWNVVRTQQEVADTLAELETIPVGLVGNWKLNEATGTSAGDFVGTNPGTLTGGATWTSRSLPASFGAERFSANAAECLADYLTGGRLPSANRPAKYGLGHKVADEDLVLSWFQSAKDHFDESVDGDVRHRLDLMLDEARPHYEWLDIMQNACRGVLIESDGQWKLAVDRETPVSQIFTPANILPGTVKHSWPPAEDFDQVELIFQNREGYRYLRDSVRSPELLTITDPSFELGGEGWIAEIGWTFVSEVANARTGVRSARRDGSAPNPHAALRANRSVGVPIQAGGEVFRVEGWLLPSGTPDGTAAARLSWRDANQIEIGTTVGNYISGGSGWQQSVAQGSPPSNAFFVVPEFEVLNHTTGIYYADDLTYMVSGRLPGAARTKVIDGRGITRRSHAQREANYHLGVLRRVGRFTEWGCALEALGVDVFDVIELALDVPKWGNGGRVAASDLAAANDVVTVDSDRLLQGTLSGYQLKLQHDDDAIETKDVVSVGAPYTSGEGYPRQDVTVLGALSKAPTPMDARWLFGSKQAQGSKQMRVVAASLTRDLDRKLAGFLYDPSVYEPSSAPSVEVHAESYLGTGVARTIFLPFTPDLVIIRRRDASARMVWRASNWGTAADEFMFVQDSAAWKTSSAYIVSLIANGVNLGTDAEVNASGGTYDLVAFRSGARFAVGGYTGDGAASGKIVGLPFSPHMVWVAGKGGTTRDTIWRVSNLGSTDSWSIKNSIPVATAKGIESTGGDSFRVRGTAAGLTDLNASGQDYVWVAWGTPAYNARLVSFAGNGADARLIQAELPFASWAWLQTVEEASPDEGGFMRVAGYEATDTAMQVVSAAAKADVMERVWPDAPSPGSLQIQMGTKGNKVHATKNNHLFVVRIV